MNRTATRSLAILTAVWPAFAAGALANTFSVSGPGGSIPIPAVTPGTWNSTYTGTPFTSSVSVLRNVTSITRIRLSGFDHTWRGDLHFVLKTPTGLFNIVVRPGSNGATAGDSGNYLLGDYDIVESGGASVAQGGVNLSGGTYNQFFNVGTGQWTSGISNTPLSGITGPAGPWSLEIRDWAAADTGSLLGWTLEGTDVSGFTQLCVGSAACPCGAGTPTAGCQNENGGIPTGGAEMTASSSGAPSVSADTGTAFPSTQVALVMTDAAFTKLAIFFEGDTLMTPTPFGDGLICVSGTTRLNGAAPAGDLTDGAGNVTYPNAVHTKSICDRYLDTHGGNPHPTGSFYYFAGYRDPTPNLCPGAGTVNFSSALEIVWGP